MVHDMYFFHVSDRLSPTSSGPVADDAKQERTRKINIWAFLLMTGPFLGAFVAAWLISVISWRADYGVLAALHVVSTLCVVFLGDETLYDRDGPQPRGRGVLAQAKLVLGITGVQEARRTTGRPKMMEVFVDIAKIQIKPNIALVCKCRACAASYSEAITLTVGCQAVCSSQSLSHGRLQSTSPSRNSSCHRLTYVHLPTRDIASRIMLTRMPELWSHSGGMLVVRSYDRLRPRRALGTLVQ